MTTSEYVDFLRQKRQQYADANDMEGVEAVNFILTQDKRPRDIAGKFFWSLFDPVVRADEIHKAVFDHISPDHSVVNYDTEAGAVNALVDAYRKHLGT